MRRKNAPREYVRCGQFVNHQPAGGSQIVDNRKRIELIDNVFSGSEIGNQIVPAAVLCRHLSYFNAIRCCRDARS